MTRPYTPPKRPSEGLDPCYPEKRRAICYTCSRRKNGEPLHPEIRQFVVIDASTMATESACPMHAPWPVVRHFAEAA